MREGFSLPHFPNKMIKYTNFRSLKKELIQNLNELWNEEFGFIFPISKELFYRNTYGTKGFLDEYSYVVLNDDLPIGFIINKIWESSKIDGLYENIGWISLIYVSKPYRKQGIGSYLIEETFKNFNTLGISKIYLGKDYQNFFPGLPKDLKENLDWFKNRGFNQLYETNDLINYSCRCNLTYRNTNYKIRLAKKQDFPQLIDFMKHNFPGRWVVELQDYINNDGNGNEFIISLDSNNTICGFCRIGNPNTPINQIGFSLTWRNRFVRLGGVGPLGVNSNFRKHGIASDMIVFAIEYLKNYNCDALIIDWTNLLSFYRKFGFEIWKTYIYLEKNLNN